MTLAGLAAGNVLRNKFRTILTVLGVAVAVVAFVLLRTVVTATEAGVTNAAHDRVGTRHRVSFVMELPKRYMDTVRAVRGVRSATFANWFGGKDARHPNDFFATLAVEPTSYLDVYDEMSITPEVRERWLADRRGAIIGDVLARTLNVRVGDRVTLQGTIYPGNWDFNVSGIYLATRRSVDRSQFLFHYAYLNESIPQTRRDRIGWIISRIDDPTRAAAIATAIDHAFDEQDTPTLSMSERAMNLSFMAMFSGMLSAINIISGIILLILLMLLGNTMSMGVRERTQEYGVLRALGFLPRHVAGFILGEAMTLGLLAGLVGLALSVPIVGGFGRWVEENLGGMFPYFRIETATWIAALAFAIGLGVASAALPALRASRLTVTDALRRID